MKTSFLALSLGIAMVFSPLFTKVSEAKTTSSYGPTAICKDGTYSYSAHRRGTCSWHKGVKIWLK